MEQETDQKIDRRPLVIGDLIWDMFPHHLEGTDYRNIQNALGLLPSDDDGLDILHKMSDKRKAVLSPIMPKLDELSGYAAEVVVEYAFRSLQARGADITEVPAEIRQVFNYQNTQILELALPAVLAHLIESGMLALTEKATAK
jgi:hypothetical protein